MAEYFACCLPSVTSAGGYISHDSTDEFQAEFKAAKMDAVCWMKFTCFPPSMGGLLPTLIGIIVNYALSLSQVVIFFKHGSWGFGCGTLFFAMVSIFFQFKFLSGEAQAKGRSLNAEARWQVASSCQTGMLNEKLGLIIATLATTKSCFVGFLAPYGMLFHDDLSVREAVVASLSCLMAIHTMAQENTAVHLGDLLRQIGKGIVLKCSDNAKAKLNLLMVWSHSNIAAEVVLNVILMRVYSPVVAVALFAPYAMVHYWVNRNQFFDKQKTVTKPFFWWVATAFMSPLNMITFSRSSVLGVVQYYGPALGNIGNKPATPYVLAHAVRLTAVIVLFCLPIGQEGLRSDIFVPINSIVRGEVQASGAFIFRSFLVGALMLTLPLYVGLTCGMFALNKWWRIGGSHTPGGPHCAAKVEMLNVFTKLHTLMNAYEERCWA